MKKPLSSKIVKLMVFLVIVSCSNDQVKNQEIQLTAEYETFDNLCFGGNEGKIDLSITGGVPPYSYIWSNGENTRDITNLESNTYSVTIFDSDDNTVVISDISISDIFDEMSIEENITHIDVDDNPAAIEINISGGSPPYSYVWSNGSISKDLEGIGEEGNYEVTVTDSNGCQKSKIIRVYRTIIDIDGNLYRIATFGSQTWMVDNLRVSKFNDGTLLPLTISDDGWITAGDEVPYSPAYTWYENDEEMYAAVYGVLYNYYTVLEGNLCPSGWRVPSKSDWSDLIVYAGDSMSDANNIMTDSFGFLPVLGGYRQNFEGDVSFNEINSRGYWWTTESYSGGSAWSMHIPEVSDGMIWLNQKGAGLCVRCIKN